MLLDPMVYYWWMLSWLSLDFFYYEFSLWWVVSKITTSITMVYTMI
jgi:hypothetical protein